MVEILEVDMEAQLFRSCLDYIGFHDGNQARLTRPYLSFCGYLRNRQVTSQSDSLTIHFISDELVEGRGVKLSYEAVSYGECDIGWLSRGDGMCYRHVEAEPKVGWADAQEQCGQMQANLASIRDQNDYDYMSNTFGHTPAHSWIGYTDADHEGTVMGVNSKLNTIWPQPLLPGNNDDRDCLYLDYSLSDREPYRIADCRTKQTFICQKRNNWSTVVVGSQHERIRAGSRMRTANYTIWLLILVALILFLILLCILCQGTAIRKLAPL
ncbi:hypothetical protein KIN20_022834 [Parelaphostrongylus tenuis]|uniref:C-type lectin domain-containing protein n=1 Tax=Parelaphostrongylus tenuis TaxID=148309 RepID=A0AAD5QV20_PARTN|nr:hypothetical protein KIN20_022834 [Parelaphostrongylus tenuis]